MRIQQAVRLIICHFTSVSDKSQITGTLKIDTATIDGEKYSDYIKADTVTYDIQMDASTEKMAGEIKLQNGSATALTATFYSDGNNMYFKVPELFSESFRDLTGTALRMKLIRLFLWKFGQYFKVFLSN